MSGYYVTCRVICPRVKADLYMANDLDPISGDVKFTSHIQSVFTLLLVLGASEILIAIFYSARG